MISIQGSHQSSPNSKQPIRLKVSYLTPQALVSQLTRGVGRGGVRLEIGTQVPLGTQFVFELSTPSAATTIEVIGTVVSAQELAKDRWAVFVRYDPPRDRKPVDNVLTHIFSDEHYKRAHPRVPLQVRVVSDDGGKFSYRLRDISLGGLGLDLEGYAIHEHLVVGAVFHFHMKMRHGDLILHGNVAWTAGSTDPGVPQRIGGRFHRPTGETLELLSKFVQLEDMSVPPWIARVSFEPPPT